MRLRLEISGEAARLFWKQGVAATSGDQIADAVGLSTRTIWWHFRSKEACAEPIVMQGVVTLMSVLGTGPAPVRDTAGRSDRRNAGDEDDPARRHRTGTAHGLADGLRPDRTAAARDHRRPAGAPGR
ncbi:TetR/AcrR family transcriptional regulator [Streptomyces milbemycinicus]|nr:TetR/AcrR family transcriptional regulator [Streptomyces milbemycinicus]